MRIHDNTESGKYDRHDQPYDERRNELENKQDHGDTNNDRHDRSVLRLVQVESLDESLAWHTNTLFSVVFGVGDAGAAFVGGN